MEVIIEDSPISLAIKADDIETVRALLASGISILEPDEDGLIPLDTAVKCNNTSIIHELIYSCNVLELDPLKNPHHLTPLLVASELGYCGYLKRWIDSGKSLCISDSDGNTPVHHLARNRWHLSNLWNAALFLIKNGATPRARNRDGQTALHVMASSYEEGYNHSDYLEPIISELIKAGADVDCCDFKGRTALHLAAINRKFTCLCILFKFDADLNVEDAEGMTVVDYLSEEFKSNMNELTTSRAPTIAEKELYMAASHVVAHVIKKNALKLHVSDKVNVKTEDLKNMIMHVEKVNWTLTGKPKFKKCCFNEYYKNCAMEIEKMKDKNFGTTSSLHDILVKDSSKVSKIANKKVFQEYFTLKKHMKDFPIYCSILESKYNAAVMRRIIFPYALQCMKTYNLELPELCVEYIQDQFTNNELMEFIENFVSSNLNNKEQTPVVTAILKANKKFKMESFRDLVLTCR